MIEVNLMPGGGRGRGGRHGRKTGRMAGRPLLRLRVLDGWFAGAAAAVAGAGALCLFLLLSARGQAADARAALALAVADSAAAAGRSAGWQAFAEQRDSIFSRMMLIEDLDARRYAWPHLLDEVSAAVPAGVWLTRIAAIPGDGERVRFQVEGNAPDNFTLTRFWNALEASFFVRDVQLVRMEHVVDAMQQASQPASPSMGASPSPDPSAQANVGDAPLYGFVLEAVQEVPPDDVLDLAPLAAADSVPAGSVTAGEPAPEGPAPRDEAPAVESVP